ncbi:amidase family protein [Curtobacterium flaccumfaciens]|nr:amidase family protein [Curtobacterium flaccumfaciens]
MFPVEGVVPASPSYDTVSVFAADLATAVVAADVIAAPGSPRSWPADAPLAARMTGAAPRIGVARQQDLAPMSPSWRTAYDDTVAAVRASGAEVVELDVSPLVDVAVLLYGGALLAERAQAFGDRLADLGDRADSTVARIVLPAREFAAVDLVRDQQALVAVRASTEALWDTVDALLLPTAPGHPTLAELAADPVGVNAWVGTYTNFVNLLDLSALAVPAVGSTRESPVGVSLIGPAFADLALADLAVRTGLAEDTGPTEAFWGADHVDLVVFGHTAPGSPCTTRSRGRVRGCSARCRPPRRTGWRGSRRPHRSRACGGRTPTARRSSASAGRSRASGSRTSCRDWRRRWRSAWSSSPTGRACSGSCASLGHSKTRRTSPSSATGSPCHVLRSSILNRETRTAPEHRTARNT